MLPPPNGGESRTQQPWAALGMVTDQEGKRQLRKRRIFCDIRTVVSVEPSEAESAWTEAATGQRSWDA